MPANLVNGAECLCLSWIVACFTHGIQVSADTVPSSSDPRQTITSAPYSSAREQSAPSRAAVEPKLVLLDSSTSLSRSESAAWLINYKLMYVGSTPLMLSNREITARVSGWVSNSRQAGHSSPLRSELAASGTSGLTGSSDLVSQTEPRDHCREQLRVSVLSDTLTVKDQLIYPIARKSEILLASTSSSPDLVLHPHQEFQVRIILEHQHHEANNIEPLLGKRQVVLTFGDLVFQDEVSLDQTSPMAWERPSWTPEPPAELLDTNNFLTPPHSLHLQAHVPGRQSYRYSDLKGLRGGGLMNLSFWYLIAPGSRNTCQLRLVQRREQPSSWKTLYDQELVETLAVHGRWAETRRTFRIHPEATSLSVEVRMLTCDLNVGELWVDELRVESAQPESDGP